MSGFLKKISIKKIINFDTVTIKLLLLVLFTTIIPLFAVTNFSIKLFATKGIEISSINLLLFIFISSFFVSIIFAIIFSRKITIPILSLVKAANIISEGNLNHEVAVKGRDEIAKLAKAFNIMTRRLKQQQQLRDNFIAALTHDLKVPMLAENQTIKYLLKEFYGPLTDEQKEVLEIIKSTNNSSLEMVETLLDVYKYDMDKAVIIKEEFNIIELLKTCINELNSLALEKKLSLKIETEFENIKINADKIEIKRVFHNLIANAINNSSIDCNIICKIELNKNIEVYQPKKIFYENTTLTNPLNLKNTVMIRIEDKGTGIALEDMPFLFKRFSLNKGRKPAGSGIGLYFSYQVITKHHGHIWVESTEGKGSSFNILLYLG
ncbi:MAG: HAMP domain-containing sensor histidine kinase [Candidatus Gastranaerophilaceae bacterium]|jgi:signal transduction histidine kinase